MKYIKPCNIYEVHTHTLSYIHIVYARDEHKKYIFILKTVLYHPKLETHKYLIIFNTKKYFKKSKLKTEKINVIMFKVLFLYLYNINTRRMH